MSDDIIVSENTELAPVASPGEAKASFDDYRTVEIARCLEMDNIRRAARTSARRHVTAVLTAGDPESSLDVVMQALTQFRAQRG